MLEYELKQLLDNANKQIEAYEKLVELLKIDVYNRDNLIVAQKGLIELYKTQQESIKAFERVVFLPPPRIPFFWGY